MMLATTLPIIPPASASLLPHLNPQLSEPNSSQSTSQHAHHVHHPHRRPKPTPASRTTTLALLAADERAISQRKMAIGMYGYSWLKPAGCGKTMLGRREEEVEREEVERQLREVEMQERMAVEAEEAERVRALAETGEAGVGERDLDEDVPDAEVDVDVDVDGDGREEEEEDGAMEGDLDDEIPDADEEDVGNSDEEDEEDFDNDEDDGPQEPWVYDSRREPDTDEEDVDDDDGSMPHLTTAVIQPHSSTADYGFSPHDLDAEAQALANAMLDEDELGALESDPHSHPQHHGADDDRGLDDEVPDADNDDAGWEHTDTELEDSEMDMSLSLLPGPTVTQGLGGRRSNGVPLPAQPPSTGRQTRHAGARVVSGNLPSQAQAHLQSQIQTPAVEMAGMSSADSSTGMMGMGRGTQNTMSTGMSTSDMHPFRRTVNPASARRNLFGLPRGPTGAVIVGSTTGAAGRLFTPSPRTSSVGVGLGTGGGFETPAVMRERDGEGDGEPLGVRRSGRRRGAGERENGAAGARDSLD